MYELIFWQNIPSPHQAASLLALAEMGHKVTLVVDCMESPERKAMGWSRPDLTGVKLMESKELDIHSFIYKQNPDVVHVISGLRGCETGMLVASTCAKHGRRLGCIAESGDPRGVKGIMRKCLYMWDAQRHKNNIDFILAMGQTGADWYIGSGYQSNQIFPFCYVVEKVLGMNIQPSSDTFDICFAGSLIQLKRVDLLIYALSELRKQHLKLSIIGDGPEAAQLKYITKSLDITEFITWHGYQNHNMAMDYIASSDLLVLPSEYDGWGAVVNEALMMGVPVVCSDMCGASDLIRDPLLGRVFKSGSVVSLCDSLCEMIACGKPDSDRRQRIREWAECISGKSVAAYLTGILESIYEGKPAPAVPWRVAR